MVVSAAPFIDPGTDVNKDHCQEMQHPYQVQDQIYPYPVVDAMFVCLSVILVRVIGANEMAFGSCQCSCCGDRDFSCKSQNPGREMDNIRTFSPVEERDKEIEVEECSTGDMNLLKRRISA
jgi:hypothetical protein